MNILQVLGQIDAMTKDPPNEERTRVLQGFPATESSTPYDKSVIISPEYCKELHEKSVEVLLRGYPGLGDFSTPYMIVNMLWRSFGCRFPYEVPEHLQPDDGTASLLGIYRRFCDAILLSGERIECVDFGKCHFSPASYESGKDAFFDGFASSGNGRHGAIVVTDKRLLIVGPRLVNAEGRLIISRLVLCDSEDTFLASADVFNLNKIEQVKFQPDRSSNPLHLVVDDIKFAETRTISGSGPTYQFPCHIPSLNSWFRIHETTSVKEGNMSVGITLRELKKQKKEVLRTRYTSLEESLRRQ